MTMASLENLYRLVDQEAPGFFQSVVEARTSARNEREFQTKVTYQIERFAEKAGIALLFREEYTLATGRADALYNRLVIEYERPGSMRPSLNHRHTRHAVDQVKRYIEDIAKKEKRGRDRFLGVALDGEVMIFARYRDGHWYEEPPLEVNRQSTARLLRSLVSLSSGRALIPENLVEDFGAQNSYSQGVARALYHALDGHTNDLTASLFRQWQMFFSQVSGYEEATARLREKKELRQFARGMGLRPETADPPRLFFVIHTYFSFLVKAIARLVLERYAGGQLGTTPLTVLANLEGEALKQELEKLEDGGIFRTLGLVNLLEGDFFSWYLQAWSPEIEEALRLTLSRLSEYNPSTVKDDPISVRDLLKKLYHYLLPRELRHDLGEYYTPDWLAERVLTQLNDPLYVIPRTERQAAKLFPARRLLDPACGSGTFLVLAIRAIKEHAVLQGVGEADTLEYVLNNVVGIDLNPLAVMAARVNYLLAIADLIPYRRRPVVLPVYLADSILAPTEGANLFEQGQRRLRTVVGALPVPQSITNTDGISKLTDLLDEYIPSQFSTDAFVERACKELHIPRSGQDQAILEELYDKLLALERQGLDGVWARVLKNAFMPLFIGEFEYVVGNPPWVNWESLPDGYRQQTAPLWERYGLFVHSGMDTILGKGKKDISTLMAYVVMDRHLKSQGMLAFVITQSVFKTSGAAQGFRAFKLPEDIDLRVVHVDDLSQLQPFEGATNRTAVVMIQKGHQNRYPVPYTFWRKTIKGKGVDYDSGLNEVFSLVRRMELSAQPISGEDPTSPWLTARPRALRAIQKVLGESGYRAREGANSGGANGVYWLEVLFKRPDGMFVVRNLTKGAKRKVEQVTTDIEPDLIFPLLRGRDVTRWKATASAHMLVVQDPDSRRGIDESELQRGSPKTFAYLKYFESSLRQRAAYRRYFVRNGQDIAPFYSMFNIGTYTFSQYKVVWREQAAGLTCAVVEPSDGRPVVPDHKLMLVECRSIEEADFLSAVLNSAPVRFTISAYSITIQHNTQIAKIINIQKFSEANHTHRRLAELGHRARQSEADGIEAIEEEIDDTAAQLWSLTTRDLNEIRQALEEMTGA